MDAARLQTTLETAARAIKSAKALLITAGAGMGVDSGLPDFRGPEGFWRAYPPLRQRGLTLPQVSTPGWFEHDPQFAWWFFGHRIELYRRTAPHNGFHILRKWASRMPNGYFVFTSNVDGHFQRAGFDPERVFECHGSIEYMQCINAHISDDIWEVPADFHLQVDMETLRAKPPLPVGPPSFEESKRILARPNILMFGDWGWIGDRTNAQYGRYTNYIAQLYDKNEPYVVIEMGAGHAVPTVRYESEKLCDVRGTLIRINPTDTELPTRLAERDSARMLSLPLGALDALTRLSALVDGPGPASSSPAASGTPEHTTH